LFCIVLQLSLHVCRDTGAREMGRMRWWRSGSAAADAAETVGLSHAAVEGADFLETPDDMLALYHY